MEQAMAISYTLFVLKKKRGEEFWEFYDRFLITLRRQILNRKKSLRELAREIDIPYGTFHALFSKKARVNIEHLYKIAVALEIPIYQLFSEEPLIPLSKYQEMLPVVQEKYRLVPKVSPASCGTSGIIPVSEIEDYLAFKEDFLKKFKNPLVTTARGDSMEPLIYDGDILLIDRNEEKRLNPDRKSLFLINFPETSEEIAITVKRIALAGSKLFIIPINPDYPVQEIDISDKSLLDFIIGEVVWIGRVIEE